MKEDFLVENAKESSSYKSILKNLKFLFIKRVPSPETADTKAGTPVIRDIIPPYK